MKKIFAFTVAIISLFSCADKYTDDFNQIRDKINEVNRLLDELCDQTNANMEALQAIVIALETRDYISSIEPIYQDGVEIGYKIRFFRGSVIAIYNGRNGTDGKPGQDGEDGKPGEDGSHGSDGTSLEIGIKQGNDGKWYWTVNGSWMRDADGNKVPASPVDGEDGKDGEDGMDGEDGNNGASGGEGRPGQDGEDGKDGADGKGGITPRMKIENGYWYISLDGGRTWTQYGKATGEDGQPGPDAVTPEVLIATVIWDDANAYFTLKSGEVITIPIKKPFALILDQKEDIPVQAGGTVSVAYTIQGVDDKTEVYCVCERGWKAHVVKENFFSGHIEVKVPYPFTDGKVLVMAQNAAGTLIVKSLTFLEIETAGKGYRTSWAVSNVGGNSQNRYELEMSR